MNQRKAIRLVEKSRLWLSYKLFRLSMRLHPSHERTFKYLNQVWLDMAISGMSFQRIEPKSLYTAECKYCGKEHDSRVICPEYLKAKKEAPHV